MSVITKIFLLLLLSLFSLKALSIRVSDVSVIIPPGRNHTTLNVFNEFENASFVKISVFLLSDPTSSGVFIQKKPMLIVSEEKFFLSPKRSKKIFFSNIHPEGDKEIYYRIVWRQEIIQLSKEVKKRPIYTLETILVINPKVSNFVYSYKDGVIFNEGNSSFKVNISGLCKENKSERCKHNIYLMPGTKKKIDQIDLKSKSNMVIKFDDKFIPIN